MEHSHFPKAPLSRDNLRSILLGDRIKDLFPDFEIRRSQLEMIKTMIDAFNESKIALVEAGTGTGKSLGYLIPSIIFAVENETKVVISTFTKNLQHQLIEKDIPLALKIVGLDAKYSLIKGKGNYLCLKRFYETLELKQQHEGLFDKTQLKQFNEELAVMERWISETETGDLEELAKDSIASLYYEVNTDNDLCSHHRCPYFSSCFTYKAKEKNQESDILIVNHSLLVAQMELAYQDIDNEVIPHFDYLVMDEAHNFIKSAMVEEGASFLGMLKTINRVFTTNNQRGVINQLNTILNHQEQMDPIKHAIVDMIDDEVRSYCSQLKQNAEIFFSQLFFMIKKELTGSNETIIRYKNLNMELVRELEELYQELTISANMVLEVLASLLEKIDFMPEEFKVEHQSKIKMIAQVEKKILQELGLWDMLFDPQDGHIALWVEIHHDTDNVSVHYVNLHNEDFLNSTLYESKKSIMMTSATLAVNKSIDFFKEQIHLTKETVDQVLPTPFNYKKLCLFMVPNDIPSPVGSDSEHSPFIKESIHFIKTLLATNNKKTLILCTSFSQVKLISQSLEDQSIPIFKQNSLPYNELMNQFKKSKEGVLIGVDTFWEGIDLPGKYLELVIIVKLPFKPPHHPVSQTMYDILEQEGQNPFMKISVPESIIRFKQGFGRLIRSKSDSGVVICLDNRIIEKGYGNQFLKSLPIGAYYYPQKTIVEKTKEFLN